MVKGTDLRMARLLMISSALIQFAWTDDVTKGTVTLNIVPTYAPVVRDLVPARRYGNHGYGPRTVIQSAPQKDNCADFDPKKEELRKTKKDLEYKEKALTAAGHFTQAMGKAAGVVPIFGEAAGAPLEAAGSVMLGAGAATGAAAIAIDVESRELEYTKCFKKEFDEFKNDFGHFKEKMNEEFSKIHKTLDAVQDQIQKGFDEVLDTIEKNRDEDAMKDYTLMIVRIHALKKHVRLYAEFPTKDNKSEVMQYCLKTDPFLILHEMEAVHVNTLRTQASKHMPIIRNRYMKMRLDLINILEMEAVCFSISKLGTNEEARKRRVNETGAIVKNTMENMMRAMREAMNDTVERVLPRKFRELSPLYFETCPDLSERPKMQHSVKNFYDYLHKVHSWAEWGLVPHAPVTGVPVYLHTQIRGEVKREDFTSKCDPTDPQSFAFIWCDTYDDDVRKQNAERFIIRKKLDKSICDRRIDDVAEEFWNELIELPLTQNSSSVRFASSMILVHGSFFQKGDILGPMGHHKYLMQGSFCGDRFLYFICF